MVSATRYSCSNARNNGICDNRLTLSKSKLEHAVLDALQHHLMDPELCGVFCEEYTKHKNRLRMERNASYNTYRAELSRLDCERDRIIAVVKNCFANDDLRIALDRNVDRREELTRLLENMKVVSTLIHPKMAERYHKDVMEMVVAMNGDEHRMEAADLICGLTNRIDLTPIESRDGLTINLHDDLAGILGMAAKDSTPPLCRSGYDELQQVKAVVGAGFVLCDLFKFCKKRNPRLGAVGNNPSRVADN